MANLYKLAKSSMIVGGLGLLAYGLWDLLSPIFSRTYSSLYLFGIFPIYVGAMLILIAIAMKEDWFTNARRYW